MGYSAESVHYLYIAYAIFIGVQVGYIAWLCVRWSQVQAAAKVLGDSSAEDGRANE